MTVYGITGGVGMGKTAIQQFLENEAVVVVDTDQIARELVRSGEPAMLDIVSRLGSSILDRNGELDRKTLGKLVFADAEVRAILEQILHPRIRTIWTRQIAQWLAEGRRSCAVVIPLLFETGAESEFNAIICVACSQSTQMRRLLERGWSPEHAQQRIDAQWPVERKIAKSDYVVWTEGPLEVSHQQLRRILRHF